MDRLGRFEPSPAMAVAVSGGADSMALAILARDWTRQHDGSVLAFVVDHGLRAASAGEARITVERLASLGIPASLLTLSDLRHGSALAERARIMRYQALTEACEQAGILHLLLGHHEADQVETLAMRVLRGSQTHGLAGMSALTEVAGVRLLRPLLGIEPSRLRQLLVARGANWVEDPSNQDPRALRSRLRQRLRAADAGATGLRQALASIASLRSREEADIAAELAERATIRPEGFALLSPGRIGAAALRCLIQTIGGEAYAPSPAQIGELAARPRPATVAGVRILPAGRFGDGLLIVREEAAIGAPVPVSDKAIWDDRFRLLVHHGVPDGHAIPDGAVAGKLGSDAPAFRTGSDLPSAVLRTLPVIRIGKVLAAVPHLGYAIPEYDVRMTVLFSPRRPAAGPCFVAAR
jgi:tRNA(Ile)-lysidine synthase